MSTSPRPALVVIDVQQGFDDPVWGQRNNQGAEDVIADLLSRWRHTEAPVVHVGHDSTDPESPLRPGQWGNAFKPEVAPEDSERVFRKTVNSAFIGTGLAEALRRWEIHKVVLVGLTTNHCISTTARMAGNLGFDTFVIHDATAAFDRRALDGTIRPADEVHAGALSDIHGEFATVISASEAIERSL